MSTENTQKVIAEQEAHLAELDRQEARLPRNGSQATERKLASIGRNRARVQASIERLRAGAGEDEREALPTGCAHCLNRIAGRTAAPCPSHGDEWEVGR